MATSEPRSTALSKTEASLRASAARRPAEAAKNCRRIAGARAGVSGRGLALKAPAPVLTSQSPPSLSQASSWISMSPRHLAVGPSVPPAAAVAGVGVRPPSSASPPGRRIIDQLVPERLPGSRISAMLGKVAAYPDRIPRTRACLDTSAASGA